MSVTVSVKWQKELLQDVEIDFSQPPLVFKGQLYALTGVPPERQKIMVKGGVLQDYGEWPKVGIKQGQRLMMMGTADAVPVAPTAVPVFVEDLPQEDQDDAIHRESKSAGLVNLGNTCYMNSTVQCLHAVPELKSALSSYKAGDGVQQDLSHKLALSTKELFAEMGNSLRPVTPRLFLQTLRQKFPQFAQTGEHGMPMQQDAEECWTQLVSTLFLRLRSTKDPSQSVVKELFGIGLKSVTTCAESESEKTEEQETAYTLKCHITSEVNQLSEGIKGGLSGNLEKHSSSLGRTAIFTKSAKITELPLYMSVQFVRFFWKRESQQKAKILRKVGFPLVLDVYDFCDSELQAKLEGPRKKHKELLDLAVHAEKGKVEDKNKSESGPSTAGEPEAATSTGPVESSAPMEADAEAPASNATAAAASADAATSASGGSVQENGTEKTAAAAEAAEAAGPAQETAQEDVDMAAPQDDMKGAAASSVDRKAEVGQQTGMYDLIGVLTHKGRSADSGHYVAWVKQENGKWIEFDDEDAIPRREEDITKLSGGGDWHMAYILLYKARTVKM